MDIDIICDIKNFRNFMILSTCHSFIPSELYKDVRIFPERPKEYGTMYVEAEDKQTILKIGDITFVQAVDVLGIIYTSKSSRTNLKWRNTKDDMGKLTGKISSNSLVNLFASGVLDEEYIKSNLINSKNKSL